MNLAKCAKTKYLLEIFSPLSFVFQDMPPQCEMLSPRPRCLTWNTKEVRSLAGRYLHACTRHSHTRKKNKRCIHARACTATHIQIHDKSHAGARINTADFSGCCCVSSASAAASVPSPYSTCGAIISWHTYPPLNDFSSSSASHLIKVESLMPLRDPTAFSRIHCHYENEWRQLRTQMFFHIMTESLLMCLVIFTVAAFDWRPWSGDSTNHVTHLTHYLWFLYLLCVSPSHPLSVSLCVAHRDH